MFKLKKIRNSLSLKTSIGIIVCVLLVLVPAFLIVIRGYLIQLNSLNRSKVEALKDAISSNIKLTMMGEEKRDVSPYLQNVIDTTTIEGIRILDTKGIEKWKAELPFVKLNRLFTKEELNSFIKSPNYILKDERVNYILPIRNEPECFKCHSSENTVNGFLEMQISLSDVYAIMGKGRDGLIAIGFFCTTLIILGMLLLMNSIKTRINLLDQTMKVAKEGNLNIQAVTYPMDEIGELGQSLNTLLSVLKKSLAKRESVSNRLDKLASIGELAAGIAHEIKNPLAGISATLQVIEKDLELDQSPENKVAFNAILSQIDRINSTITNLLRFAKINKSEKISFSINNLISRITSLIKPQAMKFNAEILFKPGENIPSIFADSNKIEQALINILLNSIQAGQLKKPNKIEIATKYIQQNIWPQEPFVSEAKRNELHIIITDTGSGIVKENLEKIFSPFYTTKETGTGLGLAISKKAINDQNGQILISSEVNKGTTVTIIIPVQEEDRNEK